jgi:hypothetical protein
VTLSTAQLAYSIAWATASLAAIAGAVWRRDDVGLMTRDYAGFLLRPWKVAAFFVATSLVVAAAPYSGDWSWDTPDSILVSTAVFLLAPWSVAVLFRDSAARRFGLRWAVAFVALWATCWTYDAYILVRDGAYPPTWASNLGISGPLTVTAGMFWNLGRAESESSVFAFRWKEWPAAAPCSLRAVLWPAMLVALPMTAVLGVFVALHFLRR